ncbi:hypothetical protein LCAA2362_0959 [Lacticaseibacillus casei A2-362]|nr:hypothetical protein LCAA2362_0959 [Lacticaseibacillus casei A2-362]
MRYPKRAYTFSVDYFSTPESVDPFNLDNKKTDLPTQVGFFDALCLLFWSA